jgi:hypothetical protein
MEQLMKMMFGDYLSQRYFDSLISTWTCQSAVCRNPDRLAARQLAEHNAVSQGHGKRRQAAPYI